MIYSREPNEEESDELRRMIRHETGRISQRARLILLSSQRRTTTELAEIFSTDKVTVRRWIHRFNVSGPRGLYDEPRPGRPRKDSPSRLEKIANDGSSPPVAFASIWSPNVPGAPPPSGLLAPLPDNLAAESDEEPNLTIYTVPYTPRLRTTRQSHKRKRVRC